MAENAALKGRVADLERELEEALCKLKLGSASPGNQFNRNIFGLSFGLKNHSSFGLRFLTLRN